MNRECEFKNWSVSYAVGDGARISRLCFNGFDLLTDKPDPFLPPQNDFGKYETRPVYGYDDCFPTVDACKFPGSDWPIPDHGELCWLTWQVKEFPDRIIFFVRSKKFPLSFKREMQFTEKELIWHFEVRNQGSIAIPFLHVMHPVMPMSVIKNLVLPDFGEAFDEIDFSVMEMKKPVEVTDFLFGQPKGKYQMILLRNINEGRTAIEFNNGVHLEETFPIHIYPTLGIYWNNEGYPNEKGIERFECAIEPIPGTTSELAESHNSGTYLSVEAGQCLSWQVNWKMNNFKLTE